MTVAGSVADVLDTHEVFEMECIDRMYCNVYMAQLQHAGGRPGFAQCHLGFARGVPLRRDTCDPVGMAIESTYKASAVAAVSLQP